MYRERERETCVWEGLAVVGQPPDLRAAPHASA